MELVLKKILFATLFILTMSIFALPQNKLSELKKIKKIKIFKSTQKDVQKLLPNYIDEDSSTEDSSAEVHSYIISAEIGYINIDFSKGNCGEDEYWNVRKGLVTGVSVSNFDGVKVKDLGFNLKKFKKEIEDEEYPEDFKYHNEKAGIRIDIEDGEVRSVVFYPPKSKKDFLCTNENTKDIFLGKEQLVDTVSVISCILINRPPTINRIMLSETEVSVSNKNERIKIALRTDATDPENDVLTYSYEVSGGEIIGQGSNVTWDLTNVKRGTYTVMVKIDDGCGDCAEPKTKIVVVK